MSEDALRVLRTKNATFINNFIANDVASHDQITHKDFVSIYPSGERVGKAEYLKRWATGFNPERIVYYDYRDELISVFGPTALVRSSNKSIVVENGTETTRMTSYTDVYILEDGDWTCIQAQITLVAPAHYPPDALIVKKYVKGVAQP